MSDVDSLPRDGGEPARPMTGDEIVTFAREVAPILGDQSKVDVAADEHGGLTVTLWADDEDGGVVTFAPVTAVKKP